VGESGSNRLWQRYGAEFSLLDVSYTVLFENVISMFLLDTASRNSASSMQEITKLS